MLRVSHLCSLIYYILLQFFCFSHYINFCKSKIKHSVQCLGEVFTPFGVSHLFCIVHSLVCMLYPDKGYDRSGACLSITRTKVGIHPGYTHLLELCIMIGTAELGGFSSSLLWFKCMQLEDRKQKYLKCVSIHFLATFCCNWQQLQS